MLLPEWMDIELDMLVQLRLPSGPAREARSNTHENRSFASEHLVEPSGTAPSTQPPPATAAHHFAAGSLFPPATQQSPERTNIGLPNSNRAGTLTGRSCNRPVLQRMPLSESAYATGLRLTSSTRALVGDGRKAEVYEADIEKDDNQMEALTSSAGVNAVIGSRIHGKRFTKKPTALPTGDSVQTIDPFFLDTKGSYEGDTEVVDITITYQHADSFHGYVTGIQDTGSNAEMMNKPSVKNVEVQSGKYGHQHEPTREAKLIETAGKDVQTPAEKKQKLDAYTKISGEGARWKCVRAHAANLKDTSVFYVPTSETKARGVTFRELWTTWKRTFRKACDIADSEVADKVRSSLMYNQSGDQVGREYDLSTLDDTSDYNLSAPKEVKEMEYVQENL